tara:strand:+ start:5469 stop:5861 length:393 start_codon:yes stop_codon:yes gene_type:complete
MAIDLRDDPTKEHLNYFRQEFLIPTLSENLTEQVDIGQGEKVRLPKYEWNTYTSKVPKRFTYESKDGEIKRSYKPRKLFFNQNKGLKTATGKYRANKVEKAVAAATKMPKMKFSLKPVALIKPTYGEVIV